MSLEYALLGFLNYEPMSGYDLKKVFDDSVTHFWSANQSQIYRTLARLVENSWAEMELVPQEDRPNRKVYHLTAEGRAALHEWLHTPYTLPSQHISWLIQIFFAAALPHEEFIALLEDYRAKVQAQLANYQEHVQDAVDVHSALPQRARDKLFWQLTLDYGMMMRETELRWAEHALARICEE